MGGTSKDTFCIESSSPRCALKPRAARARSSSCFISSGVLFLRVSWGLPPTVFISTRSSIRTAAAKRLICPAGSIVWCTVLLTANDLLSLLMPKTTSAGFVGDGVAGFGGAELGGELAVGAVVGGALGTLLGVPGIPAAGGLVDWSWVSCEVTSAVALGSYSSCVLSPEIAL